MPLGRIVATVLLLPLLLLGLLGASPAQAQTSRFVDVPPGAQFYNEIEWTAAQSISTGWQVGPGVYEYRPVTPINRDAMAAFLYRLAGQPVFYPTRQTFVDVPPGTQFYTEIEWLATQGVTNGWLVAPGVHEYRPVTPINRDAMAAFLYRFADAAAGDGPARSLFSDVPPGTQFYAEMSWLASQGISTGWWDPSGCPTFRPVTPINRDAMAAFLYRFVNGGTAPLTNQCGAPYPQANAAAQQLTNDFNPPSSAQSRNALEGLTVAAPNMVPGYDRALFPHWRDADTWGWPPVPVGTCDVRQAALYREGANVSYNSDCDILGGSWLDAYTEVTLYAASDVDIDHIIPLAEAWRTGAAAWTTTQRTAFANDKLVVLAVDDGANASKGDKTPDLWKPPNQAAHCLYAQRWIEIKAKYALTVSASEKPALHSMINTCTS